MSGFVLLDAEEQAPARAGSWLDEHPEVVHSVWAPGFGLLNDRIFAVQVVPPSTLLALRGWDDAPEGVWNSTSWVVFDLEKALRMLLRQSPLALQTFAGTPLGPTLPPERVEWVLQNALSRGITAALADFARTSFSAWERTPSDAMARDALRWIYAAHASTRAIIGFEPQRLADALARDLDADLQSFSTTFPALAASAATCENVLPDSPRGYDALSRWLVDTRLATRA